MNESSVTVNPRKGDVQLLAGAMLKGNTQEVFYFNGLTKNEYFLQSRVTTCSKH